MIKDLRLENAEEFPTPSLVVYPEIIAANIRWAITAAGSEARLRPHVKTHKTIEITQMLLMEGVTKHKCATIAEAEMLALAGAPDVLIAYPLVGPNVKRLMALKAKFPTTHFSSLIDHPHHAAELSAAAGSSHLTASVVLDLDVGQHRTGCSLDRAEDLYTQAATMPNLKAEGFQTYDGHNHQESRAERESAVRAWLAPVLELRSRLESRGFPVPKIVAGGTPNFPVLAAIREVPGLECSPGTFVLHDDGYGSRFPDVAGVRPAAVLLTRVVSRPTPTRVTLDLGTKAVASDPPTSRRVKLLDFPQYEIVGHNEEHLVAETSDAEQYQPGDLVYALPGHVCPTVALHRDLLVAERGRVVGTWRVAARDRTLTC